MKHPLVHLICIVLLSTSYSMAQQESKIYFDSLLSLKHEGHYNQIIALMPEIYEKDFFNQIGDSIKADFHYQSAIAEYRVGKYAEAISEWEIVYTLRRNYLEPAHLDIIRPTLNIANSYLNLSQYEGAKTHYLLTIHLLQQQEIVNQYQLARVYGSLGRLELRKRDFDLAEDYLLFATSAFDKVSQDVGWNQFHVLIDLANLYLLQQDTVSLMANSKQAFAVLQAKDPNTIEYPEKQADSHNILGIAHEMAENIETAIYHFNTAKDINSNLQNRDNELAIAYNNLISLYAKTNQFEKGILQAQQAKELFNSIGALQNYIETGYEEAKLLLMAGDTESALSQTVDLLSLIKIDAPTSSLKETHSTSLVKTNEFQFMQIMFLQAQIKLEQYNVNQNINELLSAWEISEELISTIIHTRREFTSLESQMANSAIHREYFEFALNIAYRLTKKTNDSAYAIKALRIMDESKASGLYMSIWQSAMSQTDSRLSSLLDHEKQIKQKQSFLKTQLWQDSIDNKNNLVTDSILYYATALDQVRDSIFTHLSSFKQTSIIDENYLNKLTDNSNLIIQYFQGEEYLYRLVLTPDTIDLAIASETPNLIRTSNNFIAAIKNNTSTHENYSSVAQELYPLVLPPINTLSAFKHITVIPDGILHRTPFEALISDTDNTTEADFTTLPYLLKDFIISYAFSLSVLQKQQEKFTVSFKNPYAGFACDYTSNLNQSAISLPQAVEEIKIANTFLDGNIFINDEANIQNFRQELTKSELIHISAHGYSNISNPAYSYIQLSEADSINEGKLYALDIYNTKIQSPLIVLSACNTGSGQLSKGEGILSMAHAFSFAGAKSVLMNLWQIPATSSLSINQLFYAELNTGADTKTALSKAKIKYINTAKAKEICHPAYWASMIISGNSEYTVRKYDYAKFVFGTVLLFILGLIAYNSLSNRVASS